MIFAYVIKPRGGAFEIFLRIESKMEKLPVLILFSIRVAPLAPIPLPLEKIASLNIVLSSIILVKNYRLQILGKYMPIGLQSI